MRVASPAVAALLATALAAASGGRQADRSLPVATIIPALAVAAEPTQTYALYLPSTYTADRKWPVIFAFDPAANARRALECFREAAERRGYVLAASNVSRNGPMTPSIRAGVAMMRDALDRLAVDERRLYVTGFSGGARVATAIAIGQEGRIAGVIGAGAGFPAEARPSAGMPFAFCGTIGDGDYNWLEMHQLDRTLASLGRPHRLLRFSGGHTWPPPDVAMAALEWLDLGAMRAGTRPRDGAIAEAWLERDLGGARDLETRGAFYEAWQIYSDLAAAYAGLADVQPAEARASSLRGQDAVRKETARRRRAEAYEADERAGMARDIAEIGDFEQQIDATRRLSARIATLRRDESRARFASDRLVARRLIEHASITAYYAGQAQVDAGDDRAALPYLQLQALIHPESSGTHYRLAVGYARVGNRQKALDALKTAARAGFSDLARLEGEPGLEALRSDPRFRELLELVRANTRPS